MKKIYLSVLALAVFTVSAFFSCKKEDVTKAATTTGSTTSSTGGTTTGTSVGDNQLIFDGETISFISAIGMPSSSTNKYTITGASLAGASLTVVLPDSLAPAADRNYTLVPYAAGLILSGNQATYFISNTPKHMSEQWGPQLTGTLELKIVSGKIQVKFVDVASVKVGTVLSSIKATAQMTTIL